MRKVDLEKHEEKRRQILDAAEWCFARDGFQGASTSDICARAKISPGHLYHYFASKEAIVGAIIEARLEHVAARFSEMMQSAKPVETLVREIERARWRKRGAGQHLLLDMLAEAGRNPAMAKIVSAQSKKLHGFVADFLRDAQTRGQVDGSLDADVAHRS